MDPVMRPYLDRLSAAIAAGERVDGRQMLFDLQRDLARDAAERVFTATCTDPDATPAKARSATTAELWKLTSAMGETSRAFGVPERDSQQIAAHIVTCFGTRLSELCDAGHMTEVMQ